MSARRVVITGMGWVTPLGCDVDQVWSRLLKGESGIGPVTRFDAETFKTNFAAEVKDFRIEDFLERPVHEAVGINTRFALAAAAQAWKQSGLGEHAGLQRRRFGAYLGAGEGRLDFDNFAACGVEGWDADGRRLDTVRWARSAYRRLDGRREIEQEPNMVLGHLASHFGCQGPSSNCMTACAAGTQAVGEAFEILRHGEADVMFAGGTHSMIHPLGMTGFIRLTAMSTAGGGREDPRRASRPFSRSRAGFVMGEGAGMIILESLEHALARGATPLAEVVGYGSTADAYRITDIDPEGRGGAEAMMAACRQAGVNPREPGADGRPQVQYISAHGTGTPENDGIETKAVKWCFGPQAPRVPFSSVKSMLGHLIQAAGAVELMTCVQAIRTGWLPPTMNLDDPDPACDLDYVPNAARDLNGEGGVSVCLSNGFGFGGQNDTVCVRRCRP